jgi:hypothetical protein
MSSSRKRALSGTAFVLGLSWLIVGNGDRADATVGATAVVVDQDPLGEPITGDPLVPSGDGAVGPLRAFEPPPRSPGDVSLDALSDDEQEYVVRGDDGAEWARVHAGFSTATAGAAKRATAQRAANALGVGELRDVGVVP